MIVGLIGAVVHFASATTTTLFRSDPTATGISSEDRSLVLRKASAALPHQFPNFVTPPAEFVRSHCRHHASIEGDILRHRLIRLRSPVETHRADSHRLAIESFRSVTS